MTSELPWRTIPVEVLLLGAALIGWLGVSFWQLPSLPRLDDDAMKIVPSVTAWRRGVAFLALGIGVAMATQTLAAPDSAMGAYATMLVVALVARLATGASADIQIDAPRGATAALLLGFAALLLRLAAPASAPYGLSADEAALGLSCVRVLEGASVWLVGEVAHPMLPCVVISPLLAVFGPSVAVIHNVSVVAGALSVVAFYFLAAQLLAPATALVATALLVVSPYHLLYSRVAFGAEILLTEILLLAFAIDAARRLRWLSAALAGASLGVLLHQYVAVRAMPLVLIAIFAAAQLEQRRSLARRIGVGMVIISVALMVLLPLLLRADGRAFLFQPVALKILRVGAANPWWQDLWATFAGHLKQFDWSGKGSEGALSHWIIARLPVGLELLLMFGIADAVWRAGRFTSSFLVAAFVLAPLPGILAKAPNSHRSMMVLPILYLVMGSGLERMLSWLPSRRGSARGAQLLLLGIVLLAAVWGVRTYFVDAWQNDDDVREFGGFSTTLVNEVQRLNSRGEAMVTSVDRAMVFGNLDALRSGSLGLFSYARWLPENGRDVPTYAIFDHSWIDLASRLRDAVGAGALRPLVSVNGAAIGASWSLSIEDLRGLRLSDSAATHCGALMLKQPRRIVQWNTGEARIDGIDVGALTPEQQPWFSAGLHEACIETTIDAVTRLPDGSEERFQRAAADLYRIAVHGWLHRIECVDEHTTLYLAVEPFLFGTAETLPFTDKCLSFEHTWWAQLAPDELSGDLSVVSLSRDRDVVLGDQVLEPIETVDGATRYRVPELRRPTPIRIRIRRPATEEYSIMLGMIRGKQNALVPRYEAFTPDLARPHVGNAEVRWAQLTDGRYAF